MSMKSLIDLLLLVLSFIFIGNGCEQTAPSGNQPIVQSIYTNSFFPMHLGDYWIYTARGNTADTLKRSEIFDTTIIAGNKYFALREKYLGKISGWKADTMYLRFIDSNRLVRRIGGIDSIYINLASYMTSSVGPKYPGIISEFPINDSIPLGSFDSVMTIIFRSVEPNTMELVKNLGEIARNVPTFVLVAAKIGSTYYP